MDYATEQNAECRTIELILVGGAIGGLIGMLIGPLGMLVCAVIGAGLGNCRGTEALMRGRTDDRWLRWTVGRQESTQSSVFRSRSWVARR